MARFRKRRRLSLVASAGAFVLAGVESVARRLRIAFLGIYKLDTAGAPGQFVVSGKAAALSRTVVQSSSPLSNLASNTVRALGPYANTDPQFSTVGLLPEQITDFSGIAFDSARNRVLMFGGGHGPSQETDIRVFDLSTLTWSSLYTPTAVTAMYNHPENIDSFIGRWITTNQPTARHTVGASLVRGNQFLMYVMGNPDHLGTVVGGVGQWGGRTPAKYDFSTSAWTWGQYGPNATGNQQPWSPWADFPAACLDPVSNSVLIIGGSSGAMWLHDPDADTFTTGPVVDTTVTTTCGHIVYYPPNDKFYFFNFPYASGASTPCVVYEITLDCNNFALTTSTKLTTSGAVPSAVFAEEAGFAYDSVNQIIGGQIVNGTFYTFNPNTRAWTAKTMLVEDGGSAPNMVFHCICFDSGSGCYIFLQTDTARKTTWAYRP